MQPGRVAHKVGSQVSLSSQECGGEQRSVIETKYGLVYARVAASDLVHVRGDTRPTANVASTTRRTLDEDGAAELGTAAAALWLLSTKLQLTRCSQASV